VAAVELQLPASVQFVWLARLVVCAAARQAGMSGERVEDLRIAVSEATTNAIVAQRDSDAHVGVILQFGVADDGTFEVTIVDSGPGFEPVNPASMNGRDWSIEGGLGITIIRELADDVRFLRADGMRVSMRFAMELEDPPQRPLPLDGMGAEPAVRGS
jgi:serine/threonine-protein kinase RsbW